MLNVSTHSADYENGIGSFGDVKDLPIRAWQEHTREVFSVDWSNIKKDTFASSSWDGTVKLVRILALLLQSQSQPKESVDS